MTLLPGPFRVPSMAQLHLFDNYLYLIGILDAIDRRDIFHFSSPNIQDICLLACLQGVFIVFLHTVKWFQVFLSNMNNLSKFFFQKTTTSTTTTTTNNNNNKWYIHNRAPVLENNTHKPLADFDIHTDNLISVKRTELIIINKKKRICKIVDFAVPADHRIKLKECEKKDKYLDFARGLKKLWNMQGTIIPK